MAGVIVGVVTFVCSVGNVPFAVILLTNGIAFGGVMSFVFADLIVPTVVDAYRRYYGLRMAAVLFVSIFARAVIAGGPEMEHEHDHAGRTRRRPRIDAAALPSAPWGKVIDRH